MQEILQDCPLVFVDDSEFHLHSIWGGGGGEEERGERRGEHGDHSTWRLHTSMPSVIIFI